MPKKIKTAPFGGKAPADPTAEPVPTTQTPEVGDDGFSVS